MTMPNQYQLWIQKKNPYSEEGITTCFSDATIGGACVDAEGCYYISGEFYSRHSISNISRWLDYKKEKSSTLHTWYEKVFGHEIETGYFTSLKTDFKSPSVYPPPSFFRHDKKITNFLRLH